MVSEFSYLNITSIGRNLIQDENDCGYACLEIPACFSYNVAAFSDVNGKLLCELLPSDKFNHSDKFNTSREFHHFYLPVSLLLIYHNSLFSRGNLRATLLLSQVSNVSICKRTTSWSLCSENLKDIRLLILGSSLLKGHNFSLTCLKMLARDKQRATEQNVRCWLFCSLGKNSEKPKRGVGNQRLPPPPFPCTSGRSC